MIIKRHWTPRFIINRVNEIIYRKRFPDAPWLTPAAIRFLDLWLNHEKSGIELGSGRSTLWIAKRCGFLISVESDTSWYAQIERKLREGSINNVNYIFAPVEENVDAQHAPYLEPLRLSGNENFDFVLVDGHYRDHAALIAISKLKSGGVLIVDNANWYLPSNTVSPFSVGPSEKCKTTTWMEFEKKVSGWRKKWTSSGITDTVLFFKP